jgi:glycosyltransferase involved in cell wall biosynthesis
MAFERKVAGSCDAVIFDDAEAAERFQAAVPEAAARVHHVPVGINSAVFSPRRPYPNPFEPQSAARPGRRAAPAGRNLIFAGPLSERASAEAAVWFVETVLPRLRTTVADCRLVLAGTEPHAILRALAERPGVLLIDDVADIRPYLAHASAAVAPQRGTGGPRHELLAAMAMARPVVATSDAAGACRIPGMRELWLAQEPEEFVRAIAAALSSAAGAVVGRAGRARVQVDFDWDRSMDRLEAILEGASTPAAPIRAQHRTAP